MKCPKCNIEMCAQSGELHGLSHDQIVQVCAFNSDCDFGNLGSYQIFTRDEEE